MALFKEELPVAEKALCAGTEAVEGAFCPKSAIALKANTANPTLAKNRPMTSPREEFLTPQLDADGRSRVAVDLEKQSECPPNADGFFASYIRFERVVTVIGGLAHVLACFL